MSKISDFFKKITQNLDKVHVRAAFIDVEHRIEHVFRTYEKHGVNEQDSEKDEKE